SESCTDASCTKYYFETTSMNWSTAQTHCREKYTDLATVNSQEEVMHLLKIINTSSSNIWIGMYRDVKENWQWSSGDDVTYNMRPVKSFCARLDPDGRWTDSVCHATNHFMCYNGTSERYILIEELKTWTEAQQYCREHHTDLVSVKNADENIQIKEKAKGAAVWIGLFNNPWKWSDGGDYHTFLNWSEKQPDNYGSKEKCVMIKNQSNTPELSDAHAAKSTHLFAMTIPPPQTHLLHQPLKTR
ncbi:L-selectin-like, partial [Polyodon spathula]|uniref:L-selectin-like n=1 Tax=Polyodon spathula TaxID=7913 RepID=UPI001B7F0301